VPVEVGPGGELPVLSVRDCPYPELAERDRGICAMEKMLFSRLLQQDVRLTECRLDGHACCQFEASVGVEPSACSTG
jgi:DeoR family suf operon transcriptional repressor